MGVPKEYEPRVALVTGGGRGIGRAAAIGLARAGLDVALTYREDAAAAERTAEAVRMAARRTAILQAELSDPQSVRAAVRETLSSLGRLDVLVLNAGHWNAEPRPIAALGAAEVRAMFAVHVESAFAAVQEALPGLRAHGTGRVICLGSTAGVRGEAEHAHYAAAKGALLAFVRSLAVELGAHGITANVVAPGWVRTAATASVLDDPARRAAIEAAIPTGRISEPEDVAAAVVFLASHGARQITGIRLDVNGGAVFG